MTEPISNEYVNIHGVTFRRDQLDEDNLGVNGEPMAYSNVCIWQKGEANLTYGVRLQDGTYVEYTEQLPDNNAHVIIGRNGTVDFFGLEKAIVLDTQKNDCYDFTKCKQVSIYSHEAEERSYNLPNVTGSTIFSAPIEKDKDKMSFVFCEDIDVHKPGATMETKPIF